MKIYNTMTRKKEEFVPIHDGEVGIYVCGPTVYDYIHIGNARPMIVFDTLRRYLIHQGYKVNYVSNFTDVDDKIIKRANEEGVSSREISERFIAECYKDMDSLHVRPATVNPKATEEIPEMVEMVKSLINMDYAYEKNGTVYFRTRSFEDYGKLSHKNIDDLESGHRDEAHALKVDGEEEKEDPLDFVLWKPKKEGEPSWMSPWGSGRPGWHLECSCMAKKYIGDTIDIHAGGEDLIFPHHENEIAQSEAANGTMFAKYWMHNAFLKIDNQKMSKSLGNFFTVREISEKYSLNVIRFFMLSAHYRSPLNFSDELVEAAKNGLERIQTAYELLEEIEETVEEEVYDEAYRDGIGDIQTRFFDAMEDDLNTADAISVIFDLVKLVNTTVASDPERGRGIVKGTLGVIEDFLSILGIDGRKKKKSIDSEIEALIAERQEARKNKDFARADEIRDQLLSMGVTLKDTREGVKWSRE